MTTPLLHPHAWILKILFLFLSYNLFCISSSSVSFGCQTPSCFKRGLNTFSNKFLSRKLSIWKPNLDSGLVTLLQHFCISNNVFSGDGHQFELLYQQAIRSLRAGRAQYKMGMVLTLRAGFLQDSVQWEASLLHLSRQPQGYCHWASLQALSQENKDHNSWSRVAFSNVVSNILFNNAASKERKWDPIPSRILSMAASQFYHNHLNYRFKRLLINFRCMHISFPLLPKHPISS